MDKIFISYSRSDLTIAQSVSKIAKQHGYNSPGDFAISTIGDNFAKQITIFIKESDFVIFIVSNSSLDSQWCRREVEFAIQQGKNIIPILYDISEPDIRNSWLYNYAKESDWINWNKYGEINLIRALTKNRNITLCERATADWYKHNAKAQAPKAYKRSHKIGCGCSFLVLLFITFVWGLYNVLSPSMSKQSDDEDYYDTTESAVREPNSTNENEGSHKISKPGNKNICHNPPESSTSTPNELNEDGESPNMSVPSDEVDIYPSPAEQSASSPNNSNETVNSSVDSLSRDIINVEGPNEARQPSSCYEENNEPSYPKNSIIRFCIILFVFLLTIIAGLLYRFKFQRISIKLVSDTPCDVYADNNKIAVLSANCVVSIKLKRGTYYISFKPKNKSFQEKKLSFAVKQSNDLINMTFEHPEMSSTSKTIKCFIAGSTKLESERDALRAAIAQTHNQWASKNVDILSYTYEDFERKVIEGGHQQLYDDFIKKEATIAIFIISGEIGEFTISEFEEALNAYKSGNHPQILVFNDENAIYHEQAETLKQIVASEKQYWVDYDSLKTLKLQFMSTLNWLLIDSIYN